VGLGGAVQRAEHAAASSAARGAGDEEPGISRSGGDAVVVVEVAAEALLVREAGDAHDHRVAVLPVR
jgi:hypothetical protein